jgi:hypothetical protein
MLTTLINSCKPDAKKKGTPNDQSSNSQWGHRTLAGLSVSTLSKGTEIKIT